MWATMKVTILTSGEINEKDDNKCTLKSNITAWVTPPNQFPPERFPAQPKGAAQGLANSKDLLRVGVISLFI